MKGGIRSVFLGILVVLYFIKSNCSTLCSIGQLLDEDSRMCEFCSVVCENAAIQGTINKCLNNCPGYLTTTSIPNTTDVIIDPSMNSTWPLMARNILIVILVGMAIVVLVVGTFCYRREVEQSLKIIGNNWKPKKYPIQAEGKDSDDKTDNEECPLEYFKINMNVNKQFTV